MEVQPPKTVCSYPCGGTMMPMMMMTMMMMMNVLIIVLIIITHAVLSSHGMH